MATGAADKLEGMRTGVGESGAANSMVSWWIIIIVVLVFIVLLVIYLKRKQGDEADSIEITEGDGSDVDLGEEQWNLLRELSELVSVPVDRLTRDKKSFEKAVHEYISEVSDFFPRPAPRCEAMAELRRSLGFVRKDTPNLYSTRGFHTGDELRLSVAYQRNAGPVEGTVRRMAEDFLEVDVEDELQTGDEVIAVALIGAGRYSFHSRIVRTSKKGRRVLLEHTTDLERRERRSSRRVETEGPIYCRPDERPDADWQEMQILDLSEGGARLRGERVSIQGTDEDASELDVREMEVRFLPADLFDGEIEDEDLNRWIRSSARVVGVDHMGVDDYEYRLSFVDADRPMERTLSKVLYMLETRGEMEEG